MTTIPLGGMRATDVRRLRADPEFVTLRERFRRQQEAKEARCWRCHGAIDYRLELPHPDSWDLDHAMSLRQHPEVLCVRKHFRSSHHDCRQRDDDEPRLDIGAPSEIW